MQGMRYLKRWAISLCNCFTINCCSTSTSFSLFWFAHLPPLEVSFFPFLRATIPIPTPFMSLMLTKTRSKIFSELCHKISHRFRLRSNKATQCPSCTLTSRECIIPLIIQLYHFLIIGLLLVAILLW